MSLQEQAKIKRLEMEKTNGQTQQLIMAPSGKGLLSIIPGIQKVLEIIYSTLFLPFLSFFFF